MKPHLGSTRMQILIGVGVAVLVIVLISSLFFPQRHEAQPKSLFDYVVVDAEGPDSLWQKSVGDINSDGLPDLLAGGQASGGLVWYESPGWMKRAVLSDGSFSTDAEVADVDNDGDNDIISLLTTGIVWLENPSWELHTIEDRVLHDVEVSDFDGDGDVDLVTRNQGEFGMQGDVLHFYWQNDDHSWTHESIQIENGEGLKVADIDGDGDKDIVVNGSWYENAGRDTTAWMRHSFTVDWSHPNAFVGTGDINDDGRIDIVLAPSELAGQIYRISWFEAPLDPTSGGWSEHVIDENVEAVYHFIDIADMDNDGDNDIATAEMAQGQDPDEVKLYLNDDGSGLAWSKSILGTKGSHSMRVVDVDGDGDKDLYGANWQGNLVELWVNQSCSVRLDSWQRHVIDSSKPWRSVFIDAADLDQDGRKDIITGGWWYQNPGRVDETWPRTFFGDPLNNMASVADFDGNGRVDVLGTQGKGSDTDARFVWARNDGAGSFAILDNVQGAEGDFLQGVAEDQLGSTGETQVALSWHGQGNGIQTLTVPADPSSDSWNWERISTVSQDEALSSGDIDGDSDVDLLLGTIWLENTANSWQEHVLHDTDGAPYGESDPDRNRLVDINGDGRLDAVIGYEAINVLGKLAWYEQGADAKADWEEHVIASVIGPMSLDVVDIDKDGDLDVIVGEHNLQQPGEAKLIIFENADGGGDSWLEHLVHTGDEHHDGAQVVDIDGDSDLDVISIGWGHSNVLLYENTSPICSPPGPATPVPTATATDLPTATPEATSTIIPGTPEPTPTAITPPFRWRDFLPFVVQ